MAGAISDLTGIAGGIVWQILEYASIVIVAVLIFYAVKYIQKRTSRAKSFNTIAAIVDMNGVWDFDKLAFVKAEESGLLEMVFQTRKNDSVPPIPKHLIRNNIVILINYAPGHYCVFDPFSTVANLRNGINKIVPINIGMKKYINARQRDIMNKSENRKKKFEMYAPWITLGICILFALLAAWAFFYFGSTLQASNVAARLAECQNAAKGLF